MQGADAPPLYEQLFEITLQICGQFPALTPISIREQNADEVITMFCRYIALARRKNGQTAEKTAGGRKKEIVTRSGQRYIINRYEDESGLNFGG